MFLKISIAVHGALLLVLLGIPKWTVTILAGYAVYHVFLARAVLHPRSRLLGANLSRLGTRERVYALTFDDGPHPTVTPRVLDILRSRGVRATFFLIGAAAEAHPEIVRRIVAEGHEAANHTQTHPRAFFMLPPGGVLREVSRAKRAIEAASGRPCRFFRAPVGMKGCALAPVLEREALLLVSWNVRFLDRGRIDGKRLRSRLARRVVPGSILMMHDGHDRDPRGNPDVVEKLPAVLDALDALGYRSVELAVAAGAPAPRAACSDR